MNKCHLAQPALSTHSLSVSIAALFALSLLSIPFASAAGLIEPFSYADGSLTSVSGGAWQFWEPSAGDATVVNGAAQYEGTTDVIRTFPGLLTAAGETAMFSFTINVNIANTSEGYAIDFVPSSAPFSTSTNYGSGLGLGFDYRDSPPGMASIEVAEGLGTGPFNSNVFPVGSMSEGVTHNISVSLLRGPTDITSYSLFLDDSLLLSSTFVLNDPRGINAVELEQSGRSEPSPIGSALIDDLNVVPEPATYALFALGVAILLNFRRRQRLCH